MLGLPTLVCNQFRFNSVYNFLIGWNYNCKLCVQWRDELLSAQNGRENFIFMKMIFFDFHEKNFYNGLKLNVSDISYIKASSTIKKPLLQKDARTIRVATMNFFVVDPFLSSIHSLFGNCSSILFSPNFVSSLTSNIPFWTFFSSDYTRTTRSHNFFFFFSRQYFTICTQIRRLFISFWK